MIYTKKIKFKTPYFIHIFSKILLFPPTFFTIITQHLVVSA